MTSLKIKALFIIVFIALLSVGPLSVGKAVNEYSNHLEIKNKYADASTLNEALSTEIGQKERQFNEERGSTDYLNSASVESSIIDIPNVKIVSAVPVDIKAGTVKESTAEQFNGFRYTLQCKDVDKTVDYLDGYNFLYEEFNIDYLKKQVTVTVRMAGVYS